MASKLGYAASSYIRFHIQNTYGDNEYKKKKVISTEKVLQIPQTQGIETVFSFYAIQLIARMKE